MMRLQKHSHSFALHILREMLLLAVFVSLLISTVRADGGTVLWQRTTGPFTVTAFATESPLRTGPADISFLIESIDEPRPIVDAHVFIALENEAGTTVRGEATHRQARNKLLYCSLVNLPKAGHWKMNLIVEHGVERREIVNDLTVTEPQPILFAHWKLMAFPPVVMILFIINQWLRRAEFVG